MTEEELKLKAEESFEQYKVTDEDYVVSPYSDDMGEKMLMFNYEYEAEETYLRLYTQGYLAGVEPREKRIAELEKKIKSLEGNSSLHEGILWNDIHNQDKKIAELEAQIEKMKNWCNCKNYQQCLIELAKQGKGMKPSECCVNCKKWEIKENA